MNTRVFVSSIRDTIGPSGSVSSYDYGRDLSGFSRTTRSIPVVVHPNTRKYLANASLSSKNLGQRADKAREHRGPKQTECSKNFDISPPIPRRPEPILFRIPRQASRPYLLNALCVFGNVYASLSEPAQTNYSASPRQLLAPQTTETRDIFGKYSKLLRDFRGNRCNRSLRARSLPASYRCSVSNLRSIDSFPRHCQPLFSSV